MLATSGMRRITPFADRRPTSARGPPPRGRAPRCWEVRRELADVERGARDAARACPHRRPGTAARAASCPSRSGVPMSPRTTGPAPMAAASSASFDGSAAKPFRERPDPACGRAAATGAATAGPLPASGCRRRWPPAGSCSMSRISSRQHRPRPRPLTQRRKAVFVDLHHHRRRATRSCAARSPGTRRTSTTAAGHSTSAPCQRSAVSSPSVSSPTSQIRRYAGVRGSAAAASLTTRFPSRRTPR